MTLKAISIDMISVQKSRSLRADYVESEFICKTARERHFSMKKWVFNHDVVTNNIGEVLFKRKKGDVNGD